MLAEVPGQPGKGFTVAFQNCPGGTVPTYFLSSSSYQGAPDGTVFASLFLRTDLLSPMQPLELGKFLTVTTRAASIEISYNLVSESTFVLPAAQALQTGQTLHEWTAPIPGNPVARLRLDSRPPTADHPDPMFKICWEVLLPELNRITCNLHDVADGNFRELEIVDDGARGMADVFDRTVYRRKASTGGSEVGPSLSLAMLRLIRTRV